MSPLAASLVAALLVAAMFPAGGRLSATSEAINSFWGRRRWISAAAGISVAYVFVDVLPEMELQRRVLVDASDIAHFAEQRLYVLSLLSFVVFYGIEHMVLVSRGTRRQW